MVSSGLAITLALTLASSVPPAQTGPDLDEALNRLAQRPQFTTPAAWDALLHDYRAAEGAAQLPAALAIAQFENLFLHYPKGALYVETLHALAESFGAKEYLLVAEAYRSLRARKMAEVDAWKRRAEAASRDEHPETASTGFAVMSLASFVRGEFGAAIYQAQRSLELIEVHSSPLSKRIRRMSLELLRVSYGYIADERGLAETILQLLREAETDLVPAVEMTYLGTIANLAHRLGDTEGVLRARDIILHHEVAPTPGVVAYFADALAETGRFRDVLAYAEYADSAREPFRSLIATRVAEAYAETGKLQAAETLLAAFPDGGSRRPLRFSLERRVLTARGALLKARGHHDEAGRLFRRAAQLAERWSKRMLARDQGRLRRAVEARLTEAQGRLQQERRSSELEAALVRRQRLQLLTLAVAVVLLVVASLGLLVSHKRVRAARDAAHSANRAKSQFLATMSHEIRTPMNGVLGFAEILATTELSDRQREYLGYVENSCRLLLDLINDVLDLSKMEADALELESVPVDARTVVAEVMDSLSSRAGPKGVRLAFAVASEVPSRVLSDSTRLRQVLLNLVGNAIKFTERDGAVVVRVGCALTPAPSLQIDIQDTGIGIPADRLSSLFQPFRQVDASTTRKYGGTGLGLTISKNIVEAAGGNISVASELGSGTTFSARLRVGVDPEAPPPTEALRGRQVVLLESHPLSRQVMQEGLSALGADVAAFARAQDLAEAKLEHAELVLTDETVPSVSRPGQRWLLLSCEPARPTPVGYDGVVMRPLTAAKLLGRARPADRSGPAPRIEVRVLVAEDNPTNQALMRHLLSRVEGCAFVLVQDGDEAVKAVAESDFDVVLMDVQMPNVDGVEATRLIRALPGKDELPIIALTANTSEVDVKGYMEAGMNGHLSKPLSRKRLFELLSSVAETER